MKPVEFRRQVFRDEPHWAHGLSAGLRRIAGGGVALFSRPGFAGWETRDEAAAGAGSVAADDCGRLFWMHRDNGRLYRLDPVNGLVEPVVAIAEPSPDRPPRIGRILSAADRLWILDLTGERVLVIRPDSFQIIGEIPLKSPVDIAFGLGRLFAIDDAGIHSFDVDGRRACGPYRAHLSQAVALGFGAEGKNYWLYKIVDCARGFLRYSACDGAFDSEIGSFDEIDPCFRPRFFVVHPDGNLFVSDGSPVAHEFAPDGSYVGGTGDASPLTAILGLAVTAAGELFAGASEGIARFSRQSGVAGNAGVFYTRALDNGTTKDEGWHRVDLAADLNAGGAVDVFYASVEKKDVARSIDAIFDQLVSTAEKVKALEDGLKWTGPQQLRAVTPAGGATIASGGFAKNPSHSVLFLPRTHRYLWIKLQVSGLAPGATASVREMRVYYPRLSYLRYLPPVYQDDALSRDLLERFLSMFETVLGGLEATIERIPEVFDPDRTPGEFLDWLAQWLDLVVEEDWPADVRRALIQNASRLYQLKGTPEGLAQFITIVTKSRPIIRESFQAERPFVLGDTLALGIDTRILRHPLADVRREQRTVLGHASVLGATGIRATTQVRVDPIRSAAHRFTVVLNLSRPRFQRYERGLRRIIRENAPAHVGYDIRLASPGLDGPARLDADFILAGPKPMLLGYSALGGSICASHVRYGPQVGVDATLAGPAHDSTHASDCPDGE
jgi:phage tail-like protein